MFNRPAKIVAVELTSYVSYDAFMHQSNMNMEFHINMELLYIIDPTLSSINKKETENLI